MTRLVRAALFAIAVFLPSTSGAFDLTECSKNHFIIRDCVPLAVETGIGKPTSLAVDAAGNVYFSGPHIVQRVTPNGLLERVAGTGFAGFSGDGGAATLAQLNLPFDGMPEYRDWEGSVEPLVAPLALDGDGNLYIGDAYNNRVRKVDTRGIITSLFQDDLYGLWWPQGLAWEKNGNLIVTDVLGIGRGRDGVLVRLADGNCITGVSALCFLEGVTVDAATGVAYFAEWGCHVRTLSPDGKIAFAAGSHLFPRCDIGIAGMQGFGAFALAVDANGALVIADPWDHCVHRLDAQGMRQTIAGRCGTGGFAGDGGSASQSLLDSPYGIAADSQGNIYIADTGNLRVRRISADGVITTIAGNGGWPRRALHSSRAP